MGFADVVSPTPGAFEQAPGVEEAPAPASTGDLIVATPAGLYCPAGDFYIDPMRPVERAVITHAHADHARAGHGQYLGTTLGAAVLRARLPGIRLHTVAYGEAVVHRGVRISLHPAGHVLGAAQVRVEHRGQVWVVSGDYEVGGPGHNPTCTPFEPVRCDTFITECTFGLPLYRWPSSKGVFEQMRLWAQANAACGVASVLRGYSLGKAQHLLAGLGDFAPLHVHAAVADMNEAYRASGVQLPATTALPAQPDARLRGAVIVAPPQAALPALEGLPRQEAFASGWMHLRRGRQQRARGAGFVLSDHADWPGLLQAVAASRASRVIVMHGQAPPLVDWLRSQGLDAGRLHTPVR
jgi:putative mRNA 3-end processing factor